MTTQTLAAPRWGEEDDDLFLLVEDEGDIRVDEDDDIGIGTDDPDDPGDDQGLAVGVRVPYATACRAARQALRRARAKQRGVEQLAALQAVVSLTALYSKVADEVSLKQVAEEAGLHPKNAAAALRRLAADGVIVYRPGRGRGRLSVVGLPLAEAKQRTIGTDSSLPTGPENSENSGEYVSPEEPKREPTSAPFPTVVKGSRSGPEKGASLARARSLPTEKNYPRRKLEEEEVDAPARVNAREVLDLFNEITGGSWGGAPKHMRWIEEVIDAHPDLTLDDHRRVITDSFEAQWWTGGTFTPTHVYKRGGVAFDWALNAAAALADDVRARSCYDKTSSRNPVYLATFAAYADTGAQVIGPDGTIDPETGDVAEDDGHRVAAPDRKTNNRSSVIDQPKTLTDHPRAARLTAVIRFETTRLKRVETRVLDDCMACFERRPLYDFGRRLVCDECCSQLEGQAATG